MSDERPEPISPELAALLDDERSARPPHGALARVWSLTALTIGVGGVPYGGSGGSGGSGSSGSVGSSGGVGSSGSVGGVSGSGGVAVAGKASSLVVALLTTTIALGGAGVALYQRSHSSQPSRAVEASAQRAMLARSAGTSSSIAPSPGSPADTPWEVVPTPNDPAAPDLAAPGLVAPVAGPAVVAHASTMPRPAASSLSEERATLERARDALAHDDGAQALRWTDAHTRRFASGQLAEEREALAMQALVLLHRYVEARARAAHFKSTWPESLFLPTVAASLDSIP